MITEGQVRSLLRVARGSGSYVPGIAAVVSRKTALRRLHHAARSRDNVGAAAKRALHTLGASPFWTGM